MDGNIFVGFSHKDKPYCDERVPALEAVAAIRDRVWFDQKFVGIGDKFHPEIQRALAGSPAGFYTIIYLAVHHSAHSPAPVPKISPERGRPRKRVAAMREIFCRCDGRLKGLRSAGMSGWRWVEIEN